METFALNGYKGKTIGCLISDSPLKIEGHFILMGRKPIVENNLTHIIFDLLENNPNIEAIAITTNSNGKIYSK